MSKNWKGMESHPTDQYAFWKTKKEDLEAVRAHYDEVVGRLTPMQVMKLHALIDWVRSEAVSDEIYNQGDC